ncbi:MAG TPA: M3 family oligoendopeptidase [Candidatus Paceibacterota bacterium]
MLNLKTTWDLSPLLKSDDDPARELKRKDIQAKTANFVQSWKNREDYLSSSTVLKEALEDYEAWQNACGQGGDEAYYFWLRAEQDQNSPEIKAKLNQAEEFARKIADEVRFFELKISKIEPDAQARMLAAPELAYFNHFLERLFAEGRYLLSEPEERIMDFKSSPAYSQWVRMVSGLISHEEAEVLTGKDGDKKKSSFSEIISMVNNVEKSVRDSAAEALNAIFIKHLAVAEAEINAVLSNKKNDDELRGAERPDTLRHIHDDISTVVVDVAIGTIKNRFQISRDYYALRAKLMGVPKLAYHERNVPYGRADKKYVFEEAVSLVKNVFEGLDPVFAETLERLLRDGQIDVFPAKGKHNGAFCSHLLVGQPTYVLLNHTDRLNDVLTLAHEMGHAINNELMRKEQKGIYFGTSTASAEVASTFMEDFVVERLEKEADDELRLAMLLTKLNDDVSSIFRQAACYLFEQELHRTFREKGYLAHAEIGRIFKKHMADYMGEAVEQSPGSENWWVYWSHIRSFFYVYSYATGLLISKSLQAQVRGDKTRIEGVKKFLSAGISKSPQDIFADLGVDISRPDFWHEGLDEVERLLQETTELAKNLNLIP